MMRFLSALAALVLAVPAAAQVPVVQPLPPALDGPQAKMLKIMRSAARGISPIGAVMASPPTISIGAANTASTITGQSTAFGSGAYQAGDATRVEAVSGTIVQVGSYYQGTGRTSTSAGGRGGTIGQGIRFCSDAQNVDFAVLSTSGVAVYVTDFATGIRARVSAADITTDGANALTDGLVHYVKQAWSARATRAYEIYGTNTTSFRGINVDASASIWRCPLADQLNMVTQGDSWQFGVLSGGTAPLRLSVPFFTAERLGVANPWSIASGGTGLLNPGSAGTFGFRQGNGDLARSMVGDVDLLLVSASVNDDPGVNAAYTDAAAQAAMQAVIAQAMAAQPTAVIVVIGPQTTLYRTATQSRYDAIQAATVAAAGGDPRVIYVDISPASGRPIYANAARNVLTIGADNTHPNDLGKSYYGAAIGQAIVDAVRARLLSAYGVTA